jgi:hypothetical protein
MSPLVLPKARQNTKSIVHDQTRDREMRRDSKSVIRTVQVEDEPTKHFSANHSESTIAQFSVPSMLSGEQAQKEQRCTDASDSSISQFPLNLKITTLIPIE